MEQLRIAMILSTKFPTIKAYGVTTRETAKVLISKSHDVKIFCLHGDYTDSDFEKLSKNLQFFDQNTFNKNLIKYGEKGSKIWHKLSWLIGTMLNLFGNFFYVKNFKPNVIWTREPIVAYFFSRKIPKVEIILEVHSNNSKFFYQRLLKLTDRVYFFPINIANEKFLKNMKFNLKTTLAPMGISQEILATKDTVDQLLQSLKNRNNSKLNIGYVGKLAPQRYSKGFEDLIMLAKLYKDKQIDHRITIVGCTPSEKKYYEALRLKLKIQTDTLEFKSHISHSEAIKIMKSFDILILPMPKDTRYLGMPLKLLEYLAVGKITIVAESPLIKDVFTKEFQPYYYPKNSSIGLFNSINFALNDDDLKKQILLGIRFASAYTWESRVTNVLNIVISEKTK